MKIAIAQINFLVGDIEGNANKVIDFATRARDELKADLVVFPELTLCGYPPEDLILRPGLYERVNNALEHLRETVTDIHLVVGYPEQTLEGRYNSACVIYNGTILANYRKQHLPNYSVFDEKRYFETGDSFTLIKIADIPIAITICEDLWFADTMKQSHTAGAQIMLSLNASPFDYEKHDTREQTISERAKEGQMPVIYVNCVGGQDQLVFDGGSMVFDQTGELTIHCGFFEESLTLVDCQKTNNHCIISNKQSIVIPDRLSQIYQALVIGVRDYIEKNHFPGVILGLSGGIDSGLTICIAVDAIGKERVHAVMMPSRFTSKISLEDAQAQAKLLDVQYSNISIEPIFQAFLTSLKDQFAGLPLDVTEENLQARCRGCVLMALSNKSGSMVLSTGNKSEMAVGYSTLYGDMVGGFCALKDVPKTLVYELAAHVNKHQEKIPQRVITRPPSAELAEEQLDQDSLPPYPILDAILARYIEKDENIHTIAAAGFDAAIVRKVAKMVDRNEYKRRQAPPGVRISQRAFGRDRRYPITSGFGKIYHES